MLHEAQWWFTKLLKKMMKTLWKYYLLQYENLKNSD